MGPMDKPEHIRILEGWMKGYRPEELFDAQGRADPRSWPSWPRRGTAG